MDEMDVTAAESKATYQEIQDWGQERYGFHVSHLNIAKTKRKCGIIERQNYNLPKYRLELFKALHPEATDITEVESRASPSAM
jgi:hypothetical protein